MIRIVSIKHFHGLSWYVHLLFLGLLMIGMILNIFSSSFPFSIKANAMFFVQFTQ